MNILITGGTGFIGQHLVKQLLGQQHSIVLFCRHFAKAHELFGDRVQCVHHFHDIDIAIDAVINLCGEPIMGKRWTKVRKQHLRSSRIDVTRHLVKWMADQEQKPKVFISGSAIGYYGNHPEDIELDERGKAVSCFPSQLCSEWEFEALKAKALNIRVCLLRTGVVLDKHAGALKKMWMPFQLGLGGRVASGQQWFSWIHIDDMVQLIIFALNNASIEGPVNATAPNPVRYDTFTRAFSQTLSRPHLAPMPSWVLGLLFGESAQLLTEGQKVIPAKLMDTGFEYQFPLITNALYHIVNEQ